MGGIVNAHGNADFRSGNHVDARVERVEYVENLAHEPRGEQHSRRDYPYGCDAVFCGYGFNLAAFHLVVYNRAFCRRVKGVEKPYGYSCELCGKNAGGVEYLRPEICEFRSLLKVELVNGFCSLNKARVVVVHSVYVGPYLYFLRLDCRANQRSGVVRASALQVVNVPLRVAADEPLRYIYIVSRLLLEDFGKAFGYLQLVGFLVLVYAHEV